MKVLIAEDDPISSRLLAATLTQFGFEVVSAVDEHHRDRQQHAEPLQLLRPRPDVQECVRAAAPQADV